MSPGNGKPRSGSPPSPRPPSPAGDGRPAPGASSPAPIEAAVRTLQSGRDREAERVVFAACFPSLVRFFRYLGEPPEDARDLAQETLLAAFQNIGQFRFESTFSTWLRTIAENLWKNAIRQRRTRKRKIDADTIALEPAVAEESADASRVAAFSAEPSPDPETALLARERRETLARAIDELAPGQRRCVTLWLAGEHTYREIAELLHVTESTVKTQIHDAKNRLRPVLAKLFSGVET